MPKLYRDLFDLSPPRRTCVHAVVDCRDKTVATAMHSQRAGMVNLRRFRLYGPITWASRHPIARRWGLVVLATPLLYVLAFGPVCRSVGFGYLPLRPTAWIYAPLVKEAWRFDGSTILRSRRWLRSYAVWWDGRDGLDMMGIERGCTLSVTPSEAGW